MMRSPSPWARARSTTASSSPRDSTVTVNGVELDGSYNTGDAVVPAFLEGYGDYGTLPELELWLVEGLHTAPEDNRRGLRRRRAR